MRGAIQTVNARDLHRFLEVGVRFNDWIARRIADYGFEEGKDFYSELSKTSSDGRPSREYHISLDMAKELSMVERKEKGKEAMRTGQNRLGGSRPWSNADFLDALF